MSRIFGLVRQRVLAHYLGLQTDAADALTAAFRIPNFLQNLLGEGALSASFIPSYSRLLGADDEEEARLPRRSAAGTARAAIAVIVLLGELATPLLMDAAGIARLVAGETSISPSTWCASCFPGAGLLVLSAWCLGVLNSHRRFLLSYASPVVWNLAIIAAIAPRSRAHRRPEQLRRHRRVGLGAGQPAAGRGAVASGPGRRREDPPGRDGDRVPETPDRRLGIPAESRFSRRQPDLGVHRPLHRQHGPHGRCRHRDDERAGALHATGVALRHGGVGGRAARDGARARRPEHRRRPRSGSGSPAPRSDWRFYIVPSALGFLTLGGVIAGAVFQTGRSRRMTANLSGSSSPGRPPACSRPRSDGSMRRHSTHSTTPALRSAAAWCA